jgi:hypothetical protein
VYSVGLIRGRKVDIATRLRGPNTVEICSVIPSSGKRFSPFCEASRPAMVPPWCSIVWVPGGSFPEHEANGACRGPVISLNAWD